MIETWVEAPDTNGFYEVSDLGRLRRARCGRRTRIGRVMRNRQSAVHGYVVWRLNCGAGARSVVRAHRLVALAFLGEPTEDRPHVNHKNGIKTDNRVSNIEWVSASENLVHSRIVLGNRHGQLPGERHTCSKLTIEQVRAIRHSDDRHRDIAHKYGISAGYVSMLKSGKRWGKVV